MIRGREQTEGRRVPSGEARDNGERRWSLVSPLIVALAAACAASPGLWFPFLSDDWAQVDAVRAGVPYGTPFGDFRPLYMASLRADRSLWGLRPAPFHATNLLLIAAAAALVTVVVRRYTDDPALAFGAGLVFAVHPCHVENAAWIAARSDPLFSVPYLLALLAYDEWRTRGKGLPLRALILYALSLAAKETAISLPFLLMLAGLIDPRRRAAAAEWRRGYVPLIVLSLAHFFGLRFWFLGGLGRTLMSNLGPGSVKNALGLAAAAVLPLDIERLGRRPVLWGALAIAIPVALLLLARLRSGSLPRAAVAAAPIFAVLVAPYLVGFQERYLFLPAAAAAVFFAALIRATRGRLAWTFAILLAACWIAGTWTRWLGWREAAAASRSLVADLCRAADAPGVGEIVVANMPFRVHGGSVAGDFRAALVLNGRPPVVVRALTYVSYPDAGADPLDARPLDGDRLDADRTGAIVRSPAFAEVWLRVPERPYWHLVAPRPAEGVETTTDFGSVRIEPGGRVRLWIPSAPDRGRSAYVWVAGRLERLF